jgi:hypothetical protein
MLPIATDIYMAFDVTSAYGLYACAVFIELIVEVRNTEARDKDGRWGQAGI